MNIKWLKYWWRQRQRERLGSTVAIEHLTRQVDQLAGQFRAHALATDTRLSVYDVLLPKLLVDLNANLRTLADTQDRLAEALGARPADAPRIKMVALYADMARAEERAG